MTVKIPFHAVVLVLVVVASAPAQPSPGTRTPPRVQAGVGVLVGAPTGDFGTNVGGAGGISGHLDVSLGDSIVSVGGEGAFLLYGSESRKIDLREAIPDLPAVVTVTTDNQMVLVHGRVRVQPRWGRWRPFADVLGGFNYIFTTTTLEGSDCSGSCSTVDATNLDDLVPSLGAGAGVMVDVASPGGTRVDFSVRYLWGGRADYLREGAIRRVDHQAFLDVSRSRTDMVVVYLGVNFGR